MRAGNRRMELSFLFSLPIADITDRRSLAIMWIQITHHATTHIFFSHILNSNKPKHNAQRSLREEYQISVFCKCMKL